MLVAVASVASVTALLYPLGDVAPRASLGVLYLLAVLGVSIGWGRRLGLATALLSAAAYNWFHIPPTGRFTIADGENWVALAVFLVTAVIASTLAEAARARAAEAEARRGEADLTAELARLLLGGERLHDSLGAAAHRLAEAAELESAAIELREVPSGNRRLALALSHDGERLGTLVVPRTLPPGVEARLRERIVPSIEPLLAAAVQREALQSEVVEAAALRRSDVVKTAVLRAVSHDLRSPLTGILAAGEALGSSTISDEEREELAAVVTVDARRLSRVVDKLLDLSRLESGSAPPRRDWISVEEILRAAAAGLPGAGADAVRLTVDRDLPLVRADAAQLERAFANLLENAVRHGGGHPVSVRARDVGRRLLVRIVDRGPGIPRSELERVFAPFYRRAADGDPHGGSGLGLAIVRGFVEANGGRVWAESLPGQGTTFVVELPLEARDEPARMAVPSEAGAGSPR